MGSQPRNVIIYELNEVPWEVLDLYVERRPGSNTAKLLAGGRCETTVNDDPHHLQPWRTWPTFHKALYADDHNSFELGQDPETFRGDSIWDVAEANGLKIGVFGALQSWPARRPQHGGFYVPDTFARSAETYPPRLQSFQAFNLSMTRENAFSSEAALNAKAMLRTGVDVVRSGLTPWSAAKTLGHLVRERRDARHKAARPMVQVLPSFDLYWHLHRKERPNLSVFFTNHVAGMMHRYWGDVMPGYAERYGYKPDEVFGTFLIEAMDLFDHQIGRIMRFLERDPKSLLMVAASMGQAPIPYHELDEHLVLKDARKLGDVLGWPAFEQGLAMYPRTALEFSDAAAAQGALESLQTVTLEGEPLFREPTADGRTLSFGIDYLRAGGADRSATIGSGDGARDVPLRDMGIFAEARLGGGNTAHHVPTGIFVTYGTGVEPDPSRREVNVLDVAPRILDLLGVDARIGVHANGGAPADAALQAEHN
jgi:hypothetical protein